jgi:hypothetical protein
MTFNDGLRTKKIWSLVVSDGVSVIIRLEFWRKIDSKYKMDDRIASMSKKDEIMRKMSEMHSFFK